MSLVGFHTKNGRAQVFETHLEETKGHVKRLDQIFAGLNGKPKGKNCKSIAGIVEEGAELIKK